MSKLPTAAAATALVVGNVSKQYTRRRFGRSAGTGVYALHDVSFEVREGEVLGLLGPNGAGKTTLLKIISTMLYPDSGTVTLFGANVLSHPDQARKMMGLVTSDERSFYWRLTGRQNLRFFAALYGVPKRIADTRMEGLLETLGLSHAADRPFHGYSSGMKQKMAIARGLLADPSLVMYDEPTRALDPLSAQTIRQWIIDKRAQSPRQTHLIATNLMHEAERLCDRVLIISRGRIVAFGSIREIRRKWTAGMVSAHRITYRGAVPETWLRSSPESGVYDVIPIGSDADTITVRVQTEASGAALSEVLGWILSSGARVVRCESEEPTFDEVFCSLVRAASEEQGTTVAR
jgi:ABC-2 type transport system ATP-binding protein